MVMVVMVMAALVVMVMMILMMTSVHQASITVGVDAATGWRLTGLRLCSVLDAATGWR